MAIGLRLVVNPSPPDDPDTYFLFIEGTASHSLIACSRHMCIITTGSFIVVYGPSLGYHHMVFNIRQVSLEEQRVKLVRL